MPIPIKPCADCGRTYTLNSFAELELLEVHGPTSDWPGHETRRCARCGRALTVAVLFLRGRDLRTDHELVEETLAARAASRAAWRARCRRQRLRRGALLLLPAAGAVLVAIVALVLWFG